MSWKKSRHRQKCRLKRCSRVVPGGILHKSKSAKRVRGSGQRRALWSLMEVLDEHMSAIKLAYPKEYELVMQKISDIIRNQQATNL